MAARGRRRLKGGEVTAGQNNTLSARWHECAGTSARARTAHGEGSELGRRGPANLGEAGAGWRRRNLGSEDGAANLGGEV